MRMACLERKAHEQVAFRTWRYAFDVSCFGFNLCDRRCTREEKTAMSVDKVDLAQTTQQVHQGNSQSFWPITLNPVSGGPGGSQMQLGQEYEININPCDHIWLPVMYDPSLGLNPMQPGGNAYQPPAGGTGMVFYGPNYDPAGSGNNIGVGMNVFDVYDASLKVFWQRAPIFSLRFNSVNAPWFVWSLGTMMSIDTSCPVFGPWGGVAGMGDSMRAISGPISRLWVKFLQFSEFYNNNNQVQNPSVDGSQVILLSCLGFSQKTVGHSQQNFSSSEIQAGGDYFFGNQYGPSSLSVEGGGYVTPQLNSLERLESEAKKIGTSVTAEGVFRRF